jgi:anaerobic ribonucleoside-triphosphate reductase activating protein
MKLRLHHFLKCSYANGPGARVVIWVQGCPLRCPGCFNPDTHNFTDGKWMAVEELAHDILTLGQQIQGVTISGGEPLAQAEALTELLAIVRTQSDLSVVLLTGYAWDEMRPVLDQSLCDPSSGMPTLLRYLDVLLAGRYDQRQHLASGLRGSANKTVHFLTDRYSSLDFESIPPAEIIFDPDGRIIQTGIVTTNLRLKHVTSKGGSYG